MFAKIICMLHTEKEHLVNCDPLVIHQTNQKIVIFLNWIWWEGLWVRLGFHVLLLILPTFSHGDEIEVVSTCNNWFLRYYAKGTRRRGYFSSHLFSVNPPVSFAKLAKGVYTLMLADSRHRRDTACCLVGCFSANIRLQRRDIDISISIPLFKRKIPGHGV